MNIYWSYYLWFPDNDPLRIENDGGWTYDTECSIDEHNFKVFKSIKRNDDDKVEHVGK